MKRVVVFGATGMTGLCAVNRCIEKGLDTRVFVRDLDKIPESHKDKVKAYVGDVCNYNDVLEAVKDRDAVIVVLGTRNSLVPTTVLSKGMENIIQAMKANNVEIVSVCLSAFLFREPDKVPVIFKDLNADHQRMFDCLKTSGLKYIAVFPPHIADEHKAKFTVVHDKSPSTTISKYDLGDFLADCLEQPEHYGKVCGIGTDK